MPASNCSNEIINIIDSMLIEKFKQISLTPSQQTKERKQSYNKDNNACTWQIAR